MSEKFDPYHEWLGIPASEQPPHHYRLLGISVFEESPTVIENAADQRMAHLRTFQTGKHAAESQRLLNEVAAARISLLNLEKKSLYDQRLHERLPSSGDQADRIEADAFDPALAAVLETIGTSTSVSSSGSAAKKSKPQPKLLIGAAAVAVAAVAIAGLWWAMHGGGTPGHGEHVKAELAAPAKVAKEVLPKPPEPPREKPPIAAPLVAPAAPKEGIKVHPMAAAPPMEHPKPKIEKEAKTPAKKIEPPSAEEQKRLIATIDERYKPSEAKDPAAKADLAWKVLADGEKNAANPAEQFVLLRRAGELACDAGEPELMLEAVDAMTTAGFNIQPFPLKAWLLKRLLDQNLPGGPVPLSVISDACVRFADAAAAGDATEEASDVLAADREALAESKKRAQQVCRTVRAGVKRSSNPADREVQERKVTEAEGELGAIEAAQSAVAESTKGLQQAQREHEAIQAAQQRLKSQPADPDACLAVGQWYCFQKGDWGQGLRLLAKGSDDPLKSLATEELGTNSPKTEEKVARGDAWWDLAEKAVGKAKGALRQHAGHWYREALPDLAAGQIKARVEKRLAQAFEEDETDIYGTSARRHPAPVVARPTGLKSGLALHGKPPEKETVTGIVTAKTAKDITVKAEGAPQPRRYLLASQAGGVPSADIQAAMKMVLPSNLVSLQWQGDQEPVVTSIHTIHPNTRFGVVTGTVVAVEPNGFGKAPCLDVKPRGREFTERYVPHWDIAANRPDANLTRAIAGLHVGEKVKIIWFYDNRNRAYQIQVMGGTQETPSPDVGK
jgi:hypothetical protein